MSKTKRKSIAMATSAALLITACSSNANDSKVGKSAVKPTVKNTESGRVVKFTLITKKRYPANAIQYGSDKGQCHGVNMCKGSSACSSTNNSCANQNTCRGKGWLELGQQDCTERNGIFKPSKG